MTLLFALIYPLNIQSFLYELKGKGILLYRENDSDIVNGYVKVNDEHLPSRNLEVFLYTETQLDFNIVALPPNPSYYEQIISEAILNNYIR